MNNLIENFKQILIQNRFSGDFHTDYNNRLLNATDNSIYEVTPEAVIQPKNFDDVQLIFKLANEEEFITLTFTARGGGTGTNGQSLNNGITIDFSRYMDKILDFNPEEKTITVEPGVILTNLNQFLKPHGLFFAPHVSTADRATIGGMIATDAAGKGSLIYGKTSDHILKTKFILANGQVLETSLINENSLDQTIINGNETQKLYKNIIDLLIPVQDEINQVFPPLKRPLSGYNIKKCYQNNQFNLNYLIAGSEGTLGIVSEATLKLIPIPNYKALFVIHYESFHAALKDAEFLIKYNPLAIEVIDEKVQKSAQSLPNWETLAQLLNCKDKTYISNFLELVADSETQLEEQIKILERDLNFNKANFVVIRNNSQINQLWSIRSLAVGLAGKMPGLKKPVAFIEDAIVPPEHLANFVHDLQEYLETEKLNYAMYGHVDVGCIHVRPALNLQDQNERNKIRPITEMVTTLLNKYHGILWGEHGKGFRGEFVPQLFGPVLYKVLCQIKTLFDPLNRLNPGKLTHPDGLALTKIENVPMRGQFDQVIEKPLQEYFDPAILCNGNGACFNQEQTNVMCPSYKVTKDRIHSPKGRAMLTKEWLRHISTKSNKASELAQITFEAMDGCLNCKGCVGKCPTQVSIPELRSKFLDKYHNEFKRRNLKEILLGYIEHIIPVMAKFPSLSNILIHDKLVSKLGLSRLPKFNTAKSLLSIVKELNTPIYKDRSQIKDLSEKSLVIFIDPFIGFFNDKVLIATIEACRLIGYKPLVIYPIPTGKALIVGGFLKKFKLNSKKISNLFEPLFAANIPIISLENTITLMFRDEMKKFGHSLTTRVLTLAEFFKLNLDKFDQIKQNNAITEFRLLPHCTEQAILPSEANNWKDIFSHLGLTLDIKNIGCCGMAGTYGYQTKHQENSKKLFKSHWQNAIISNTLATGFSCRCQVQEQINQVINHPVEILYQQLSNLTA